MQGASYFFYFSFKCRTLYSGWNHVREGFLAVGPARRGEKRQLRACEAAKLAVGLVYSLFACRRASSSGSNSQSLRFWLMRMAQKLGPHMVQYFPLKWFPAL